MSGSIKHYCVRHGDMSCSICGSALVVVKYQGSERDMLKLVESGHRLLGCLHVNLHDKVVDGVNYRGKVFIKVLDREVL